MTMKYFLPDWEDRLDPKFDFTHDEYSKEHKKAPYQNDIYAHNLFKETPYDGLLVSLSIFESKFKLGNGSDGKYKIRGIGSIRDYLKIPKESKLEVMGDCGAFSYVNQKNPPMPFYSIANVSKIYDDLKFDYGVSVDHLVLDTIKVVNKKTGNKQTKPMSKREKNRRINLTLKNAEEFLRLNEREKYSFTPIGVAQGYDTKTYKNSVNKLIEMGYQNIALGGLVRYSSEFIVSLLNEIQPCLNGANLHLFGVLRPKYLKKFEELGVTSFDSASYLRKAWLRSGQNYLSSTGEWYAAIRVPQSTNSRILANAKTNGYSAEDLMKMEKNAIKTLEQYDKGDISLERTLKTIIEYDELFLRTSEKSNKIQEKYKKTLEEMPWKKCDCEVCKALSIHVLIFRGCNRNKRRGFHNTWTFQKKRKT